MYNKIQKIKKRLYESFIKSAKITRCFGDICHFSKKFKLKTRKSDFYLCIVIIRKSRLAYKNVTSNHLKFCKRIFLILPKCKVFFPLKTRKFPFFIITLTSIVHIRWKNHVHVRLFGMNKLNKTSLIIAKFNCLW